MQWSKPFLEKNCTKLMHLQTMQGTSHPTPCGGWGRRMGRRMGEDEEEGGWGRRMGKKDGGGG